MSSRYLGRGVTVGAEACRWGLGDCSNLELRLPCKPINLLDAEAIMCVTYLSLPLTVCNLPLTVFDLPLTVLAQFRLRLVWTVLIIVVLFVGLCQNLHVNCVITKSRKLFFPLDYSYRVTQ